MSRFLIPQTRYFHSLFGFILNKIVINQKTTCTFVTEMSKKGKMKSKIALLFIVIGLSNAVNSQVDKIEQDRTAIKSMCGCYEVGFNFAETFSYSEDSTYTPSRKKQTGALEWADLIEEEDGKLVIQHLLIVGDPSNQMIIKHWRQDWLYENTDFYMFDGDNKWNYIQKSADDVAGQWTQKVYQVDDSPRYEGSSSWVHVDGKSFWENETDAPLPRREYTQRSDYNVTLRRNRHEITSNGWIHDQDNDKIVREAGKSDVVIAQEKGYNTYVKVDDSKCQAAQDWWKDNKDFWAEARQVWKDVYGRGKNLELETKVDGKHLYEVLFDMDVTQTKSKKVSKAIKSFVK